MKILVVTLVSLMLIGCGTTEVRYHEEPYSTYSETVIEPEPDIVITGGFERPRHYRHHHEYRREEIHKHEFRH